MRAVDLIRRKRDGHALTDAELRAFVSGVVDGTWPDYQVAALLMAIVWRGMTADEAATFTDAMVRSGVRLQHPQWGRRVIDKHSTGGVGDKVSLVLAPLAAACDVVVPMISGRALGHTGGTLDKLEAIPGFRTRLTVEETEQTLARVGCVIVGQTEDIAPADRRLYALRDVTGTVESVPLIAASILSKKIAEGISGLVLDVKVGSGGFMPTEAAARELAGALVRIAAANGVRAEAVLSSMDRPLGRAVGNAVEVIEAIETLKGRGPEDTETLSVDLAARMVRLAGLAERLDEARARVRRVLASGAALERFRQMIEAQGGDGAVIDDYARLPMGACRATVAASRDGRLDALDAGRVGQAAVGLGAGRDRMDGGVDSSAGIEILLPAGADVRAGEVVLVVSGRDAGRVERARRLLAATVRVVDEMPVLPALIGDALDAASLEWRA